MAKNAKTPARRYVNELASGEFIEDQVFLIAQKDMSQLATLEMTRGEYAAQFWFGGVLNGLLVPAALLVFALATDTTSPWPAACAGFAALLGMFAYEDAYVRAGQSVPLS